MRASGMPPPQAAGKAGLCAGKGAHNPAVVFPEMLFVGSSQWELHKGICIPLAFENTHRFKNGRLKVGLDYLTRGCEVPGRPGGLFPKGWLLCHLLPASRSSMGQSPGRQ